MTSIDIKICSKDKKEVLGLVRGIVTGRTVEVQSNGIMSNGTYNVGIEEVKKYALYGASRTLGVPVDKLYIQ